MAHIIHVMRLICLIFFPHKYLLDQRFLADALETPDKKPEPRHVSEDGIGQKCNDGEYQKDHAKRKKDPEKPVLIILEPD